LMARVWPDVFVEEGTLRVHIAALRRRWVMAATACAT
jgi:DNA-binding winged helix-turn-helix (wHTH) protein